MKALEYSTQGLDSSTVAKHIADAYSSHGKINASLGRKDVAEKSFKSALAYSKAHRDALSNLLTLHSSNKDNHKYLAEVMAYISQDYTDQTLYDNYINHIHAFGVHAVDHEVFYALGKANVSRPIEVGVLNYNLGVIYQDLAEGTLARHYYLKALAAFKSVDHPPQESIFEISRMLSWLEAEK